MANLGYIGARTAPFDASETMDPRAKRVPTPIELFNENFDKFVAWHDTGCKHHSACLTCPFERCRMDNPAGASWFYLQQKREDHDSIRAEYAAGEPIRALAYKHELSTRTIRRIVAEAPHD